MNNAILIFAALAIPATIALSLVVYHFMLNSLHAEVQQRAPEVRDRWAAINKPTLGGFGFIMALLLGFVAFTSFFPDQLSGFGLRGTGVLLALTISFVLGYLDDQRPQSALVKLSGQFLAAGCIVATGSVIEISSITWFNIVFSLIWMVGLMNSMNMLDNMDGVTASVSIGILTGLGISQWLFGGWEADFVLTVVMISALVSFLTFNWHPSKMFMGDAGSLLIGTLLGYLSIHYAWNASAQVGDMGGWGQLAMVGVLFVVPLSDTLSVTINRLRRGKSPLTGGKDHTTHCMYYSGMSERRVSLFYLILSCACVFPFMVPLLFAQDWQAWQGIVLWGVCIGVFVFLFSFTLEAESSPQEDD